MTDTASWLPGDRVKIVQEDTPWDGHTGVLARRTFHHRQTAMWPLTLDEPAEVCGVATKQVLVPESVLEGAEPPPPIVMFRGEHKFLSNFAASVIDFDGAFYPTVEHAYQAAKTVDAHMREWVRTASSPAEAKRRGQGLTFREGWNDLRLSVMEDFLRQKFTRHPDLRRKLIQTHPRDLREENTWGDTFWGITNGNGENYLGKLLMAVRTEILREAAV